MKPFNLEAAKAGKPVVTRDSRDVRILCCDYKDERPVVAILSDPLEEIETLAIYGIDGTHFNPHTESPRDLFMKSEKKTAWANLYCFKDTGTLSLGTPFPSKEEAEKNIGPSAGRCFMATAEINWEE